MPFIKPEWDKSVKVSITLKNLPFLYYDIETYRIDRKNCNIHTLGFDGAELKRFSMAEGESEKFTTEIQIPLYGVQLIKLSKK